MALLFIHLIATQSAEGTEIKHFLGGFRQATYKIISEACDNAESLTVSQVKELLKICLLAVRQTKRYVEDGNDLKAIWDIPALEDLSSKLGSSRFGTATSLQNLCKQLHSVLGSNADDVPSAKDGNQKKRKAEETKEDVKKERRKKSKKQKD